MHAEACVSRAGDGVETSVVTTTTDSRLRKSASFAAPTVLGGLVVQAARAGHGGQDDAVAHLLAAERQRLEEAGKVGLGRGRSQWEGQTRRKGEG